MKFPSILFDDRVTVTATRPDGDVSGTFAACVMPFGFDAPTADYNVQSTVQHFTVLISSIGEFAWIEAALGTRPQIGDSIIFADGTKTAVSRVSPVVGSYYELEVRKC